MILSLEEVKANVVGNPDMDSANDAFLTSLIESAQNRIEAFCYQPVVETVKTISITPTRPYRTSDYLVPFMSVPVELQQMWYKKDPFEEWVVVEEENYRLFKEGNLYTLYTNALNEVARGEGFDVDYWFSFQFLVGFEEEEIPEVIRQVAREMVFYMFMNSPLATGERRAGVDSISKNESTHSLTTRFKKMEKEWSSMLMPYKKLTLTV